MHFFLKVFAKAELPNRRFGHTLSPLNTAAAGAGGEGGVGRRGGGGRRSQLVCRTNCQRLKQRSVCSNRKLASLESVL